jgi:hypothetical protein
MWLVHHQNHPGVLMKNAKFGPTKTTVESIMYLEVGLEIHISSWLPGDSSALSTWGSQRRWERNKRKWKSLSVDEVRVWYSLGEKPKQVRKEDK